MLEKPVWTVPRGHCQNTELGRGCFQSAEGLLSHMASSTFLHQFPHNVKQFCLTWISPPPTQELRSQKQKIVSERDRLQMELDHLRKCLALPAMHWPRGYFKGYPR